MQTTSFHRHNGEIHIEVKEDDCVIQHTCIANANGRGAHDSDDWAEFIVRACNNHQSLLAACESVCDLLSNMPSPSYVPVQHHPCWDLITAALNKAKGE